MPPYCDSCMKRAGLPLSVKVDGTSAKECKLKDGNASHVESNVECLYEAATFEP